MPSALQTRVSVRLWTDPARGSKGSDSPHPPAGSAPSSPPEWSPGLCWIPEIVGKLLLGEPRSQAHPRHLSLKKFSLRRASVPSTPLHTPPQLCGANSPGRSRPLKPPPSQHDQAAGEEGSLWLCSLDPASSARLASTGLPAF